MPCYLFTYHGYGTWLPDRKQGYVERKRGILPPDPELAARYRSAMTQAIVKFDSDTQLAIIDSLLVSRSKQTFDLYFVATDVTHVHLLLGWRDGRAWLRMRSTVKGSMSRFLNERFHRQEWFVEGGSRKRVVDREHFEHLISRYLPKHRGWKWSPEKGVYR